MLAILQSAGSGPSSQALAVRAKSNIAVKPVQSRQIAHLPELVDGGGDLGGGSGKTSARAF